MATTANFGLRYPISADNVHPHTDIANLASDVDDALTDLNTRGAAAIGAQAVSSGTDTTTSATYVNCSGTGSVTSFSWTKHSSDTDALLFLAATFMPTTANAQAMFGLRINSTDYDMCYQAPGVNIYSHPSGQKVVSGIPAGTYTVQVRWKKPGGVGTLTRDTNCWLSASVVELA